MTYDLAKQLKDAGFPQDYEGRHWQCTRIAGNPNPYLAWGRMFSPPNEIEVQDPTLSELIVACGDRFSDLKYYRTFKSEKRWDALNLELNEDTDEIDTISSGLCSTPDEAVAKLWLALNKKSD